jgi:hypothetical protein
MWIWEENVACMGEKGNTYRFEVEKPERERQFGISTCKLEDSIKMYPAETVWGMCGLD